MIAFIEAVARRDGEAWVVEAPRVGCYRDAPRMGAQRGTGDTVGTLEMLGRAVTILLPEGVDGIVTARHVHDRTVAVEYGQPLFTLQPAAAVAGAGGSPTRDPGPAGTGRPTGTLPEGSHAVVSPLDGIFYRSPSPGAPAFIAPGDPVAEGKTLGLVEAMKSFNAVTYGGAGLPAQAIVVECRAEDASEVRQGTCLFVVRAASDS